MKPYLHTVQYYETDKMGITHHSNYIRWMEEARIYYFDEIGWSYAGMEEKGIVSPVLDLSCAYKKTTTFGDVIAIEVSVSRFRGAKLFLHYCMKNASGEVVCEAESSHTFLRADGSVVRVRDEFPELHAQLSEAAGK